MDVLTIFAGIFLLHAIIPFTASLGCGYEVIKDGNGNILDIKQHCAQHDGGSAIAYGCIKDQQFAYKRYVGKILVRLRKIGSLLSCKNKCIENKQCNSWTYYHEGRKRCNLKRVESDTFTIEHGKKRMSGLLGCRFGFGIDGGLSMWSTWPEACHGGQCSVDGGWSTWSTWSKCDKTCGAGTQQRSRMCNNPAPAHGGRDCTGTHKRTQACNAGECPVDGGVSLWSGWSGCSKSCDHGTKTRRRTCTNPAPAHGGKACTEQLTETTGCYLRQCGCSNTYRYLGSSKGCGPKYTSQGGRCDGWQRMGLSRCQQLCNQNAAPGGCARKECHFVIWAQNPGTPPGWCQLGDKNCREHRANPPHHLYARNC